MPPVIDKEFQSLIRQQNSEEFEQLEKNILQDGCRDPLVLWGETLIDGHHRLKICEKHSVPYQTISMDFETRDDVKIWIITNQFGRRNLAPYQRGELALILQPLMEAKAKENSLSNLKQYSAEVQNSAPREKRGKTRDQLAKLAGVSHDTITKVDYIQKNAAPEQIERARQGGKHNSVNAIYNEVKTQKLVEEGITEKTCIKCNETKPVAEFPADRNICLPCRELQKHPPKVVQAEPKMSIASTLKESVEQLYAGARNGEYTIDDMREELEELLRQACADAFDIIEKHKSLLKTAEDKQKILAVLQNTETAIQKMKEV